MNFDLLVLLRQYVFLMVDIFVFHIHEERLVMLYFQLLIHSRNGFQGTPAQIELVPHIYHCVSMGEIRLHQLAISMWYIIFHHQELSIDADHRWLQQERE